MKILTLLGTRPQIIKLSTLMPKLDKYCNSHIIVYTNQNYTYELSEVMFDQLKLRRPDYFLKVSTKTPINTIADTLIEVDKILALEKPDVIVIYGDTNSCLGAISAKRRKIPIFHFEAGNRSFDQRVPQEMNRKIIDHISDINFAHSQNARKYLIAQGIRPQYIIKIGSPMYQVLCSNAQEIDNNLAVEENGLHTNKYILASVHRQENTENGQRLKKLFTTFSKLGKKYDCQVLVSTHPKTKDRLPIGFGIQNVIFHKPFDFFSYCKLQKHALCVISDSGTITQQASILQFPAVTLRHNHERPQGTDNGVLVMSLMDEQSIFEAVQLAIKIPIGKVQEYDIFNWSDIAIKSIYSYKDHINSEIWRKR